MAQNLKQQLLHKINLFVLHKNIKFNNVIRHHQKRVPDPHTKFSVNGSIIFYDLTFCLATLPLISIGCYEQTVSKVQNPSSR